MWLGGLDVAKRNRHYGDFPRRKEAIFARHVGLHNVIDLVFRHEQKAADVALLLVRNIGGGVPGDYFSAIPKIGSASIRFGICLYSHDFMRLSSLTDRPEYDRMDRLLPWLVIIFKSW